MLSSKSFTTLHQSCARYQEGVYVAGCVDAVMDIRSCHRTQAAHWFICITIRIGISVIASFMDRYCGPRAVVTRSLLLRRIRAQDLHSYIV
jgi:hypothetical protein